MQLLSKQEISALKSVERKQLIDEGVKLAKKIDLLRETVSKEEANLKKFREQSLKQLGDEIGKLSEQKMVLCDEVNVLIKKKNHLRDILKNL